MPDGQLEDGSLLNERYRIIRVIGQGGMGTVYQAEHERLNSIVAVKEIRGTPATGTAQQATMEQYEQEARFLVKLNHPNLPKVTDAFVDGDRFYLVMDFVEGATLDSRLRSKSGSPMDPVNVVDWAIEIADVLGYLHSQDPPIIFRDLKPSNVMVQPDGHIKLIDFGIARRFQPGAAQDTSLLGSVGYSPPEQFGRHQTDTRSDIYALGATLHHLLTARDPSTTPFKFPPVDRVALGVPTALSRLIAHCLAMEPELRPAEIGSVSAELRAIRDNLNHVRPIVSPNAGLNSGSIEKVTTPDSANSAPVNSVDRRLRAAVATLAVVLLCGVVYAAYSASAHSRATHHNDPHSHVNPSPIVVVTPAGPQSGGKTDPTTSGQPGSSGSPPPSTASLNPPANSGDASTPTGDSKSAQCSVEVLGPSPDGKSLRLHVTGEINDKKDTVGMVAAYFYNADKTPLPARDPKGLYASPTGQLFAQYTFQIDADTKPIDGLIDVPVEQFTSTNNLFFKCIVYSDNQSAGQTDLLPLAMDNSNSGSR